MKSSAQLTFKAATVFLALLFIFSGQLAASETTKTSSQVELEQQLADLEKEIAEYQKQLNLTVAQRNTLANKIKQLKIKQQELAAIIKQTGLKVDKLAGDINIAENELNELETKEKQLKEGIADFVRSINEQEFRTVIILSYGKGLSSVLRQINVFETMTNDLHALVERSQALRKEISEKKGILEDQKSEAVNLLQVKTIQKQELNSTITEQNTLLTQTKGLEANYTSTLADRKKRASEIRNRIYELFNSGTTLTFGQAVDVAKFAGGATGVRPAFLLAILTQESNLGKNVGTCNRAGDPPEKSWKVVMKPERDQEPFKAITESLGLNIDTTPVSCPMRGADGKQIGWGGGMGPAQFIPSTWMGWKDKVSAVTGKSPANPWDIRDAFIAAGLKLHSNGADGTDDGEWKAAMIYFSGSTNTRFRFYGDNVLATAKKYQADIDELN